MLRPKLTSAFKKDMKRIDARGWDIDNDLLPLLSILMCEKILPAKHSDHPLLGNWAGYREFHVAPDWIVIYQVRGTFLVLARTGTHSDLFKK